jgi:hypothetical protein
MSVQKTYYDINLLETSDGAYRSFCSLRKKWKQTSGPKLLVERDYQELVKVTEVLIRKLLNKKFVEDKRRILAFRHNAGSNRTFREIDFVGRANDQSLCFVEYKFGSARQGRKQLSKTIEIAKQKWSKISGFLVSTYTQSIFDQDASGGKYFEDFESLAHTLIENRTDSIFSLQIDGYKFLKFSETKGWIDNQFIKKLRNLRAELENPFINCPKSSKENFNQPFSKLF